MSVSRRQFVTAAGGVTAAAVLAPQSLALGSPRGSAAKLLKSGTFADGIASGDPTTKSIVLWTRLDGASGTGQINVVLPVTPQDGRAIPPPVASAAQGYTAVSSRL